VTYVGIGLTGVVTPVTVPDPPLLIWTLPATFPVPTELPALLMVMAPGTIGEVADDAGTFTPVPIDP
jgi:hypothetical protein